MCNAQLWICIVYILLPHSPSCDNITRFVCWCHDTVVAWQDYINKTSLECVNWQCTEFGNDLVYFHTIILTHWGRETHICVSKLTIIGADNGLSPGRCQAIIWANARVLLIGPLGTNFSEILIEIHTFSFKKMCFKMSSAKWRPFCIGLNELIDLSLLGDAYVCPLGLLS